MKPQKPIEKHNTELHNVKSIKRMNEYLKRLFFAYLSLYHTFIEARDILIKIQNDLNFRRPDALLIETYNKLITFIFDQTNGILSETISDNKCTETLLIKPVNQDKQQFTHKLELVLFLHNYACVTKSVGTISNISTSEINDHIKIYRLKESYDFVYMNTSAEITSEYFRVHLDKYLTKIKTLSGLFYNDVEYAKLAFKNLLHLVSEIVKHGNSSCDQNIWTELLDELRANAEEIYCSLSNIEL